MELMVLINNAVRMGHLPETTANYIYNHQVDDILAYINQNLASPISIEQLSGEFFLSESYICRIFKAATGTTINILWPDASVLPSLFSVMGQV